MPYDKLTIRWNIRGFAAAGLRLFVVFSLLLSFSALSADSLLISSSNPENSNQSPPTFSTESTYVRVDGDLLRKLQKGGKFSIGLVEDEPVELEVVELDTYINGDRMVRAHGFGHVGAYSMALTIGANTLYGHLSSSSGVQQLYAIGDGGDYEGWLYQPRSLLTNIHAFQNDYVILDRQDTAVSDPDARGALTVLPFKSGQQGFISPSEQLAATSDGIDSSNFKIEQKFSRSSVLVGSSVQAQVIFTNISGVDHQDLAVEFYFLLENSFLELTPTGCTAQLSLSLQEVLYCELGDFAPGQTKSLIYSIITGEESKPYVVSTPIIGSLRVDSIVNVVDDVRVDSDEDGISDFNEDLLATDPFDEESVDTRNSVIDVMAFYTPAAAQLYPRGVETRINQLIGVANQVYSDSGVGITLRPVFHGLLDYNDSDDMDEALNHLIDKTDDAFLEIDSLRARYGGDMVMLFRPLEAEGNRCGLAPVGGFNTSGDFGAASEKDYAYAYIGIDCPTDIVVAHELGHNMGLTHSYIEDGSGGTFDFSTGYGVDSQFATIMAYPAAFNTETRIARFSNPLADCFGFACGIAADQQFGADAVQSLNIVKYQIANYFKAEVPDLPNTSVSTASGGDTQAKIALAASPDNGLSFSNSISPDDKVDLVADIYLDVEDVGKEGVFNVLIGLGTEGFFQINPEGILEAWNGSFEGLIPFGESKTFNALEHLNILDDFQFAESLLGKQIVIYLAYQVFDTGRLIYTSSPLVLNVERRSADVFFITAPRQ